MSTPSTYLQLYLGSSTSDIAPAEVLSALDSATVDQGDTGPTGFQITFNAERPDQVVSDYPIVTHEGLQVSCRIILTLTLNNQTSILVDGYITHQQLIPGNGTNDDKFIITGEDISVYMDMYEYSLEYPLMPDAAIAEAVLIKWAAIGIIPVVVPAPISWVPSSMTPQQYGTDRAYLNQLACQNGFCFFINAGPAIGMSTAYWGPPQYYDPPQTPLTLNVGPGTNVVDIKFAFDALAPELIYGMVDNPLPDSPPLPLATAVSTRIPPLSTNPPLPGNFPFLHTRLFDHQGMDYVTALATAQAATNTSTDAVVTASGSLDGFRYGSVLSAPGVVPVRGAGAQFDGNYYVKSVTHTISRGGYTQDFQLTRDGIGSTISSVTAA